MGRPLITKLAKAFLVIYNVVFVLLGIVLLCGGLWMHFDMQGVLSYVNLENSNMSLNLLHRTSLVVIGLGVLVLCLAFLGCCGACCESVCLLLIYTGLLFLILLTEIVCGVLIAVYKSDIMTSIGTNFYKQVHYQYNRSTVGNGTMDVTWTWDNMQIKLQCCGAYGPGDYRDSVWFNATKQRSASNPAYVPMTCCVLTNDDARYPQPIDVNQCQMEAALYPSMSQEAKNVLRTTGCFMKIVESVKSSSVVVITVAVVIAVLQIIGLIFGCCLLARIRHEEREGKYHTVHSCDKNAARHMRA